MVSARRSRRSLRVIREDIEEVIRISLTEAIRALRVGTLLVVLLPLTFIFGGRYGTNIVRRRWRCDAGLYAHTHTTRKHTTMHSHLLRRCIVRLGRTQPSACRRTSASVRGSEQCAIHLGRHLICACLSPDSLDTHIYTADQTDFHNSSIQPDLCTTVLFVCESG